MSGILRTAQDLANEVRSQLDEENADSVSDSGEIYPSLNRAQDYAFDILARKYEEPLLTHTTLTLVSGQTEYDIPEDVFEDRIEKMEISIPSGNGGFIYRELQRISYRDISNYETGSASATSWYYCIVGSKMRIVPSPNGVYNARMWYLRNPEKLVPPQGRITVVNTASNYVFVDGVGSSLTTESDELGSYVNVVDGQTGLIKGSAQIQIMLNNKVTFRSTPTRATVLNRTIQGDITDIIPQLDDYITTIDGTCVPYFSKPVSNFMIQFAVAEITRKLGGEAEKEANVLEKFEKQMERTWAGRETSLRVKKKSRIWGSQYRRWGWE